MLPLTLLCSCGPTVGELAFGALLALIVGWATIVAPGPLIYALLRYLRFGRAPAAPLQRLVGRALGTAGCKGDVGALWCLQISDAAEPVSIDSSRALFCGPRAVVAGGRYVVDGFADHLPQGVVPDQLFRQAGHVPGIVAVRVCRYWPTARGLLRALSLVYFGLAAFALLTLGALIPAAGVLALAGLAAVLLCIAAYRYLRPRPTAGFLPRIS